MLFVHDVLTETGSSPTSRWVLWVDPSSHFVVLMNRTDTYSWPEIVAMDDLRPLIETGAWTVAEGEIPHQKLDRELPELHRIKRDQDYDVVRMMVDGHVPGIFWKKVRATRITAAVRTFDLSRPTVTGLLQRYFIGGMTRDGMVPL